MAKEASSDEKNGLLFKIERQVFTHQEEFDECFPKVDSSVEQNGIQQCCAQFPIYILIIHIFAGGKGRLSQVKKKCCSSCSANSFKNFWLGLFPIINWLPKYSWKNHFLGDFMSGSTVAIMHIPQGYLLNLL